MVAEKPVVIWFRSDLRLSENAALQSAVATGVPVLPVYILDDVSPGAWKKGGASRWWLHHSLTSLSAGLAARGAHLVLRRGETIEQLTALVEEAGASAVYFSRSYEPWAVLLETRLEAALRTNGVAAKRFRGFLLREPEAVKTQSDEPYKVFTPFWRAFRAGVDLGKPLAAPKAIESPKHKLRSDQLESWNLLPSKPNWATGMARDWKPGEANAKARLEDFLKSHLKSYPTDRDRPDRLGTSRLSPHLAFGEISPVTCWRLASDYAARHEGLDSAVEVFLKELAWREFSAGLLLNFSELPEQPYRPEFSRFPWREKADHLKAWQRGQTGYPIVDAGMRELWDTGFMHNRVRMITASFLIKHLLTPWQKGEAWFWDTLVDADLGSNSANWQWVAGSGADAAPYFRIFNPILQGTKFDPQGAYVRRWVPELAKLPDNLIHKPWEASEVQLSAAGVQLGKSYPHPIVDHGDARSRALAGYEMVKTG